MRSSWTTLPTQPCVLGGEVERRARVLLRRDVRLEVGARPEQRAQHLGVALLARNVRRRPLLAHALVDDRRAAVGLQQRGDAARVARAGRLVQRQQLVDVTPRQRRSRAWAGEQQRQRGLARLERRVVHARVAARVGRHRVGGAGARARALAALLEQRRQRADVPHRRANVQRRAPLAVLQVGLAPVAEQQPRHLGLLLARRVHERRAVEAVERRDRQLRRAQREQELEQLVLPRVDCEVEQAGAVRLRALGEVDVGRTVGVGTVGAARPRPRLHHLRHPPPHRVGAAVRHVELQLRHPLCEHVEDRRRVPAAHHPVVAERQRVVLGAVLPARAGGPRAEHAQPVRRAALLRGTRRGARRGAVRR